jgi:hypothetical protein
LVNLCPGSPHMCAHVRQNPEDHSPPFTLHPTGRTAKTDGNAARTKHAPSAPACVREGGACGYVNGGVSSRAGLPGRRIGLAVQARRLGGCTVFCEPPSAGRGSRNHTRVCTRAVRAAAPPQGSRCMKGITYPQYETLRLATTYRPWAATSATLRRRHAQRRGGGSPRASPRRRRP